MHACQLSAPTHPAHALSSLARSPLHPSLSVTRFNLVVASLNTFFGLINS
ncbi:unnamed protein product [Hymenolepis diminuta]|uniref:Uncharacterized protein n=1 Tax=Hymenolepis diminuta TaxID=6216 RepID=A0A564YRL9_HYMDI|nr:unnamed protein product [Hymenolepis diminuta]